MEAIKGLLERITTRLAKVSGVEAIVLGGSWARRAANPNSDIDIGLYYRPNKSLDIAALRRLAAEMDDNHNGDAVTDIGEWGPWINGGAWLTIEGQRVDWLYRDLDKVGGIIDDCRAGKVACHYQLGHPHGFHTHIYMAEVHYGKPLYDSYGSYARLQQLTSPYPDALKQAIIRAYLWEANFSLEIAHKSAARGEAFYVAGCLFRSAACMVQTLFALNERYFNNEKGSVKVADSFAIKPANFGAIVEEALAHAGDTPLQLEASIAQLAELVKLVEELCATLQVQLSARQASSVISNLWWAHVPKAKSPQRRLEAFA